MHDLTYAHCLKRRCLKYLLVIDFSVNRAINDPATR
jgi:hypothetical protein